MQPASDLAALVATESAEVGWCVAAEKMKNLKGERRETKGNRETGSDTTPRGDKGRLFSHYAGRQHRAWALTCHNEH
jgi:hypothetical protein